jgi:hypothetical protein
MIEHSVIKNAINHEFEWQSILIRTLTVIEVIFNSKMRSYSLKSLCTPELLRRPRSPTHDIWSGENEKGVVGFTHDPSACSVDLGGLDLNFTGSKLSWLINLFIGSVLLFWSLAHLTTTGEWETSAKPAPAIFIFLIFNLENHKSVLLFWQVATSHGYFQRLIDSHGGRYIPR